MATIIVKDGYCTCEADERCIRSHKTGCSLRCTAEDLKRSGYKVYDTTELPAPPTNLITN